MTRKISNMDDVIDSRDVAERIEELEAIRESYAEKIAADDEAREIEEPTMTADARGEAERELAEWNAGDEAAELATLRKLAEQGADHAADWSYGETLIRDSYFVDYIEQLIGDCYELPKDFNSGEWPWRHMKLDYEAAADEAKSDYYDVDFDGVTYWIRG